MAETIARFLPLGLVLLMFVVGLRLQLSQLAQAFLRPHALMLGLGVQWFGLPALALGLGLALGLPAPMLAGLVLVALAPGGVTSNYIAYVARADLALSTAMTLITTVFAGVTIPLGLALTGVVALPEGASLLGISAKMSIVAILPATLGLALGGMVPRLAAVMLRVLDPVAKAVFAIMVLATFYQNWDAMMAHLGSVGVAVVGLNLGGVAIAVMVGRLAGLGFAKTRAIMVEASLQNVALALFVAGALLQDPVLSVPALIYAIVMNLSALAQIWFARRGVLGARRLLS